MLRNRPSQIRIKKGEIKKLIKHFFSSVIPLAFPPTPPQKDLGDRGRTGTKIRTEVDCFKMADRWGRFSYPHGPSPTEESLKMQVKAVINIEKCSLSTIPILSVFNSA